MTIATAIERKSLAFMEKNGRRAYDDIHVWIKKNYGKAHKCEFCRKKTGVFNWALRKGCEYEKNVGNFIQLCRSCHVKYDKMGTQEVPILKYDIDMNLIRQYPSLTEAATDNHITINSISQVLCGNNKTSGGFIWKYPEGYVPKKNIKKFSKIITYNGISKSMQDWSISLGGGHSLVYFRIERDGWSIEKAVSTPPLSKKRKNEN